MNESVFLDLLAHKLDANSSPAHLPAYGSVAESTLDPYEIAELCLEFVKENYLPLEVR